ncbi:MAG: polyprenyl synthetase family protein [Bacteroidaceae bacterium]|nr:polyprenyl synthetase family protein [Bacteroidaceae bacterium]
MRSPKEMLALVNTALQQMPFERQPQGLYEPVKYVLSLGGKRIRPVLMLMAYELYKDDAEAIMPTAIGIETYHNYTLLHDDLMDRADVRRGKPCVHRKWDDNTAILSGDTMLVMAYQLMARTKPQYLKAVMDTFTETALEIGEGQQYDMEFEQRTDVTAEEYIEMIRLKTSVLLACALKIGAIQADAPTQDALLLYRFGERLGLAFQLQDDLLDVYGDFATFGKKIGGDILCNKKTYMLIQALNHATPAQRQELTRWIEDKQPVPEEKIAAVTALYNEIGVRGMAEAQISHYFDEALQSLESLALPQERKEPLHALALSLLNRQS